MIKNPTDKKRVVITGLGVISSLGIGWQEFWKNLIAGKSGISKITAFDTSKYDRHMAGEVKNFKSDDFIDKRKIKQYGRASQMAIAATKLAIRDAKINFKDIQYKNIPVAVGTTTGEIGLLESFNDYKISHQKEFKRKNIPIYPANSISSNIALEFKLNGANVVFATACASGNYAVGYVYDLIRTGRIDMGIAGGADGFSRIVYTGFQRILAIAPEKCQPFDKNRKGMIPGEGAGMIVMESLTSAHKRRAHIYAEVLGQGFSCDANHMTNPAAEGVVKAIAKALANSGVDKSEIDYISAHGTGTKENDLAECKAVNRVFGKRIKEIPMSSIKSMLGHTMGAAAILETISCCLAIQTSEIPPTINYENADQDCNVFCVPNKSIKKQIKIVLNNSQAFGGNNAALIFLFYNEK